MNRSRLLRSAALSVALFIGGPALAQNADPYAALGKYDYDQSRAPLAKIEEEIRATPADKYPAIEARLIDVLKSDAPFAAKHFTLRMLAKAGSAPCVPAVAPYLADEKLSHMARYALQEIAAPEAAAALRDALGKTQGRLRLGVISSLGDRHDADAVKVLAPLAADADAATAKAAIEALGDIGTVEADAALQRTGMSWEITLSVNPDKIRPDVAKRLGESLDAIDRARLAAARRLTLTGKKDAALSVYLTLSQSARSEAARGAALEGLIQTTFTAKAVDYINTTLSVGTPANRDVALAAVSSGSAELRAALVKEFPKLKPEVQEQLIPVLTGGSDLRPALLGALSGTGPDSLKAAAASALLHHGTAADAALLLHLTVAPGELGNAARGTLRRIGADGFDAALLKLAEGAEGKLKATAVKTLVDRQADAALPLLIKLAGGSDDAATEAAVGLATLGSPAQLPALVDIVVSAQGNQRTAAGKAVQSICSKAQDKAECSKAVVPALEKAKDDDSRKLLVQALSRIGDDASLSAVKGLLARDATRELAIRELADWPSLSAAPALLDLAKNAAVEKEKILSLRAYIRLTATAKDKPAAERAGMLKQALAAAQRPEEKRLAIAALADVPSAEGFEILADLVKDPNLGAEAAVTSIKLARQLAASQQARALAALKDLKGSVSDAGLLKQIDEAIEMVEKTSQTDGYILAWVVSGPYTQESKNHSALFDIAFAPEKANAPAAWNPVPAPQNTRLIQLDKLLGGNDRVAYVRTSIVCQKAVTATLELGSDDGVKVWLNGKVVHSNNATRPASEASDKVKLDLKQGPNILLIKVTQGGGEWSLIARLKDESNQPLGGVSFNAE